MKNIDTSFFNVRSLQMPTEAGDLLVAEPFLTENWFDHAVISIIDHNDDEGTTGVVLNVPILSTLDEVLDGVERKGDPVTVFCGGPLSHDRLYFVHTLGDEVIPDARPYAPGLWIGGDFNAAVRYVNEGYPLDGMIRFFIGYSGWAPGQLKREIKESTWAVLKPSMSPAEQLSGFGDAMWHDAVRQLGDRYRPWQMVPKEARDN